MKNWQILGLGSLVAVIVLATACTDDSNVVSSETDETGGRAGSGASGTGGNVSGTGGALTGGQAGNVSGGAVSTGGEATGGSDSGGSSTSGGVVGSGGAPTGGVLGDGGSPTGGVAGGGGTADSGGTAGTGAMAPSGGFAGSSGAPGTGGSSDSGGQGGAGGSISDDEARCLELNGTVQTALCCEGTGDFPNQCLTGPCGCAPDNSHEIKVCQCPDNRCFDGQYCLRQDPGQVYVLWKAPGGAAGTGPALELVEDGTLRLWEQTSGQAAHGTTGWDYELSLTSSEQLQLANLLSDIDYGSLPHPETGFECYPSYHFESTAAATVDLNYASATALTPEFDAVYAWLDSYIATNAPDYEGWLPSSYCDF